MVCNRSLEHKHQKQSTLVDTHLLQLESTMGFQVVGHAGQLPIAGKPKHISYKALSLGSRWFLGITYYLDTMAPLTGGIGWRCRVGQPGDVLQIFHFHVGDLSPHLTLAVMNKFQWRRLYKQSQNSNDK